MKERFNLLLSKQEPMPAEQIYDSSADNATDNVELRRTRLKGDLAIECIHAHAFLGSLNAKTGIDPRFKKIKNFVLNRFIKKIVYLHSEVEHKSITHATKRNLEDLKNECASPEYKEALSRLCLDSQTKYEDLLNANIVYLTTGEKIKFVDHVNREQGFSTIITKDMLHGDDGDITREKTVNLCERWLQALYANMNKPTQNKKDRVWPGWMTDGEHQGRNWFGWACDTVGNAFIAVGNYIKVSKPEQINKQSDTEIEEIL